MRKMDKLAIQPTYLYHTYETERTFPCYDILKKPCHYREQLLVLARFFGLLLRLTPLLLLFVF